MTQTDTIKDKIMILLEDGHTDLTIIYDKIEKEMSVPRPSIRRAKCELVTSLQAKINGMEKKYASVLNVISKEEK